jgi:hypothetical protein
MPRMLYQCGYGSAPGPDGVGRIAMYEIHDLAGDRVETGFGETVFENPMEAVAEAMTLGRDAVERLQKGTLAPNL